MDADTATRSPSVLLAGGADWQAATAMRLTEGTHDVSVDTAADAAACLAALATGRHPDAVVVAPELPDGDGVALCERIRERYDLPAVLYTQQGTAGGRAREAGVPVVDGGDDLFGRLAAAALGGPDDGDGHLRAFVEAVEQSGHSIYVTDRDGTIEYVNPTFEETTGYSRAEAVGRNPRILQSGRHDDAFYETVWDTILAGEVWEGDIVNRARDGREYHVHQTIAPITDEEGVVRRFVAVNADITERRRHERELGRQRDLLDRLNRVNATVWAVSQALLRARTPGGIEEAVCERLADTGLYVAAWVGGYDDAAGTVTPRVGSGTELPGPVSADGEDAPPAVRAARSGEVVLVREDDPSRPRARAFVALAYDGVTHGVLSVRGEGSRCIGEYERTSLRELGRTVGYAVAAARARRLLDADDAVELTLASDDDRSPLVRAAGADARLSLSASVPGSDGRELYYLTVAGEDPAGAVDRLRATEGVEQARVARETGDGWLVELAVTGPSLPRALADTGAHVAGATAAEGRVELRVELPPSADVRRALRAARTAFPELELVAKRTVERSGAGDAGSPGLTERQRATLQAAYHGGYFDWPRASTAQELAGTMGVSDVTFHKHLRRAEGTLLEWYLG